MVAWAGRPATTGRLVGRTRGEIELDGKILVLTRIQVDYSGVQVRPEKREAADRALSTHQQACPVARSIEGAITVTTAWAPSG